MKSFVFLLVLFLALLKKLKGDLSIYIDNSLNPPAPDGSITNPYNNFDQAYSQNISQAIKDDNVTVIFMATGQPYTFGLNYIAASNDTFHYNISFEANITETMDNTSVCGSYPVLMLTVPSSEYLNYNDDLDSDSPSPTQPFLFESSAVTMSFQYLNLTIPESTTNPQPLSSLGYIQATDDLEVIMSNVCIDLNNGSISNSSTNLFTFASDSTINITLQNITLNSVVNVESPTPSYFMDEYDPWANQDNFNSESAAKLINIALFEIITNLAQPPSVSVFNLTNVTMTQNISCPYCINIINTTNVTVPLQFISFSLANIINITFENVTAYNMSSLIDTTFFYLSPAKNTNKSDSEIEYRYGYDYYGLQDTVQAIIYCNNVSMTNVSNMTFLSLSSGLNSVVINYTNLVNATIVDIPFIIIGGPTEDLTVPITFSSFNLTNSSVTNTSFMTVGLKFSSSGSPNNSILFTDLEIVNSTIANPLNPQALFVNVNCPLAINTSLFSNNTWTQIMIFESGDNLGYYFNMTNTTFINETYSQTTFYTQQHVKSTAATNGSVFLMNNFSTLVFSDTASFIVNQGFIFVFSGNTLNAITVNAGHFIGTPLEDSPTPITNKQNNKKTDWSWYGYSDFPSDCKTNCYYLEISSNSLTQVTMNSQNIALFPSSQPNGITVSYALINSNTFNDVTIAAALFNAINIDNVQFNNNNAQQITCTGASVVSLTTTTSSLDMENNAFNSVQALDFLYYQFNGQSGPTIALVGNILVSSTYIRSFITISTPQFATISIVGTMIIGSDLICTPDIKSCRGISIESTFVSESTLTFQANTFQNATLDVQGTRTGYQPDFKNSLVEIQMVSSSTISIETLTFDGCIAKAIHSLLLRVGAETVTIDSLTVQNTQVENMDFDGAISILTSTFTLTNSQFGQNNVFSLDQARFGFTTGAFKVENPGETGATSVTIQSLSVDTNQFTELVSLFMINLPQLTLNVQSLTLNNSEGVYFYVYSQQFTISFIQITYGFLPLSSVLYIPQGSGTVQIDTYSDSPAVSKISAPLYSSFYFNGGQNIAITMSNFVVETAALAYVNLNASQLTLSSFKISQMASIKSFEGNMFIIQGNNLQVNLNQINFVNNNAISNTFMAVQSGPSSNITITATNILAQKSTLKSIFDLSQYPQTTLNINSSVFDRNTLTFVNYGTEYDGDLFGDSSFNLNPLYLSYSIFTNHLGTILQTVNPGTFKLDGVALAGSMSNSNAPGGIALFSFGSDGNPSPPQFQLSDSSITGISNSKIVAVLNGVNSTTTIWSTNLVNATIFNTNTSAPAECIGVESSTLTVNSSNFMMNTATATGGSISMINSNYDIKGNNFLYNLGNTGGAVYIGGDSAPILYENISSSNSFTNNWALSFGNDFTGDVNNISVSFVDNCPGYNTTLFSKYISDEIIPGTPNQYTITNFSLFAWNCKILNLTFQDYYGSPVNINPDNTIITVTPSNNVIPSYDCEASYCLLNVSSIQMPANTSEILIGLDIGLLGNITTYVSLIFNFMPRTCIAGEYSQNGQCNVCPYNTFSSDNSSACQPCPIVYYQGYCLGGDIISLNQYYWREPGTSNVFECPHYDVPKCIGGVNASTQCLTGYTGPLCLACDPASKYGPSIITPTCSECSSAAVEVIVAILLNMAGFLFEILYIYLINRSNRASLLRDAPRNETFTQEKYLLGVYFGFVVNNFQILYIIMTYLKNLFSDYGSTFQALDSLIGFIASPSTSARTRMECILADAGKDAFVIFKYKVFVEAFLPVLKIIVTAAFFFILRAAGKIRHIRSIVSISILTIVLLEQPGTFLNIIRSMSCSLAAEDPPGYVKNDLRISCGDSDFQVLKGYFLIPTAIFWGFAVPIGIFSALFHLKRTRQIERVKKLMGDLINNFKIEVFYWGVVLAVLKVLLTIIFYVIPTPGDAVIPALTVFLIYYSLNTHFTPYQERGFQNLDRIIIIGYIAMLMFASFGSRASGAVFDIGYIGVFALCLSILVFMFFKAAERVFFYVKAWRQIRSIRPMTPELSSFEDSYQNMVN